MLFVTNCAIFQSARRDMDSQPKNRTEVRFPKKDYGGSPSVFFCEREGDKSYEIGSTAMLERLKKSDAGQILLYIHGYNNQPDEVFARAGELQKLLDDRARRAKCAPIELVPIVWPCGDKLGMVRDYFDDQASARNSAAAFARALRKFLDWRGAAGDDGEGCYKRISVLCHSMGNRVLRYTLAELVAGNGGAPVPYLFRNIFMVAADIFNRSLEPDREGRFIPPSGRNVVVYYAGDDAAMKASYVANARVSQSQRLGHTGPANMAEIPDKNVYAIDCDDFNSTYDVKGHSYFITDPNGNPGATFNHIFECLRTGRVPADPRSRSALLPAGYDGVGPLEAAHAHAP